MHVMRIIHLDEIIREILILYWNLICQHFKIYWFIQ